MKLGRAALHVIAHFDRHARFTNCPGILASPPFSSIHVSPRSWLYREWRR
jgi:hypothetical protein